MSHYFFLRNFVYVQLSWYTSRPSYRHFTMLSCLLSDFVIFFIKVSDVCSTTSVLLMSVEATVADGAGGVFWRSSPYLGDMNILIYVHCLPMRRFEMMAVCQTLTVKGSSSDAGKSQERWMQCLKLWEAVLILMLSSMRTLWKCLLLGSLKRRYTRWCWVSSSILSMRRN